MTVRFQAGSRSLSLPLKDLSDGEKCFLISAVVLASLRTYGPSLCFWDEPDSHLALAEIGHFIMALRQIPKGSQFIATSHHPETIRRFSNENTLLLHRPSHLEPTQVRPVSELTIKGDLVDTLIRGDELPWP
jgi:predicted ATPase